MNFVGTSKQVGPAAPPAAAAAVGDECYGIVRFNTAVPRLTERRRLADESQRQLVWPPDVVTWRGLQNDSRTDASPQDPHSTGFDVAVRELSYKTN